MAHTPTCPPGPDADSSARPTTGRLQSSQRAAGIDPKDIDAVVMTHAHIDRLGGNNQDDGTSNFPNAKFYIAQGDFDFWPDESNPKEMKTFTEHGAQESHPEQGAAASLQELAA